MTASEAFLAFFAAVFGGRIDVTDAIFVLTSLLSHGHLPE
jgi:hypothetical protein